MNNRNKLRVGNAICLFRLFILYVDCSDSLLSLVILMQSAVT